jgi:hypothetical protein
MRALVICTRQLSSFTDIGYCDPDHRVTPGGTVYCLLYVHTVILHLQGAKNVYIIVFSRSTSPCL